MIVKSGLGGGKNARGEGTVDHISLRKSQMDISKTFIDDINAIIDDDLSIDRRKKSKKVSEIMATIDLNYQ